jgi:hypothetical protein
MHPKQVPIMSEAEERYMAFEGLVQWTAAAISAGRRIAEGPAACAADHQQRRLSAAQMRTEHHFFVIASHKVLEHRDWIQDLGLCGAVDFSVLDQFDVSHVRDLRNMREHVIDYFKGIGRDKDRWKVDTPEFIADASACVGTIIGGRLDWKLFTEACERLLPLLLSEPIPYPPPPMTPLP